MTTVLPNDLQNLITALSSPTAYSHPVDNVTVCQTHISVVFLAEQYAYKIKKPVRFDFLDYSTLDLRKHFCNEEVRLNRRLAPDVYLGVVPISRKGDGIEVGDSGEVVEWAVQMRRLPDEATLHSKLTRDEMDRDLAEELGRRIAAFHRMAAEPVPPGCGRFDAVACNIRELFREPAKHIGITVQSAIFERLRSVMEETLESARPLIESRAARGMVRACHGDLHLDHVYHFPERTPPADLAIVDCIEFGDRFRFLDPVADMAFAFMDFAFHGRRDLGKAFADSYFAAADDADGRQLLPLFSAYRAVVRAVVDELKVAEPEISDADRQRTHASAQAHWLLALGEIEPASQRPFLLLVGGLPGAGKSTLARNLAERAHFQVIRSDEVRKQLAGMNPLERPSASFQDELYSAAWNDRTYAECVKRAEHLLLQGERVLIDASFREESRRREFRLAGQRLGVRTGIILCRAKPHIVKERIERRRGDVSDADWAVYQLATARWEPLDPATMRIAREIDTSGSETMALEAGLAALSALGG